MNLKAKLEALRSAPRPQRPAEAKSAEGGGVCLIKSERFPLTYEIGGTTLNHFLGAGGDGWYTLFGEERPGLEGCLFVDTETTGLGGVSTTAFLVGLGFFEQGTFVVEQLLMRDFPEESDMLTRFIARAESADAIISFNGKSFDLPLLESRCRMNRMRYPCGDILHFDLLHAARRLWRERLQGVALSRLEARILGLERVDDLDGAEIPGRYFRFLQTGEEGLLDDILSHNLQDILSMPLLAAVMAQSAQSPLTLAHNEDVRAVGRMRERLQDFEGAEDCYVHAGAGGNARAQAELGFLYKRTRQQDKAIAQWEAMAEAGQGGILPLIELAKIYEHKLKDSQRALECTQRAAAKLRSLGVGIASPEMEEVMRRMRRLQRRIAIAQK